MPRQIFCGRCGRPKELKNPLVYDDGGYNPEVCVYCEQIDRAAELEAERDRYREAFASEQETRQNIEAENERLMNEGLEANRELVEHYRVENGRLGTDNDVLRADLAASFAAGLKIEQAARKTADENARLREALQKIARWADKGRHEEDFGYIGSHARAALEQP